MVLVSTFVGVHVMKCAECLSKLSQDSKFRGKILSDIGECSFINSAKITPCSKRKFTYHGLLEGNMVVHTVVTLLSRPTYTLIPKSMVGCVDKSPSLQ